MYCNLFFGDWETIAKKAQGHPSLRFESHFRNQPPFSISRHIQTIFKKWAAEKDAEATKSDHEESSEATIEPPVKPVPPSAKRSTAATETPTRTPAVQKLRRSARIKSLRESRTHN
jgi:hypothetical protein